MHAAGGAHPLLPLQIQPLTTVGFSMAADTQPLNRRLVLTKLALPGGSVYGVREDDFFSTLRSHKSFLDTLEFAPTRHHREDIGQQVLLELCEELRTGLLHSVTKAYLRTKVRNESTPIWRRENRFRDAEVEELDAEEPSPAFAELLTAARWALNRLPDRHQEVLRRRFPGLAEGTEDEQRQTLQELAQSLSVSAATVMRWQQQAVRLLVEQLLLLGYDVSDELD